MSKWRVFDRVPPGKPSPGGGSGEIPQQVLDDLYNHINAKSPPHIDTNMAIKIDDSITTKDIVFPIPDILEIGAIKETEFLFPYQGNIKKLTTSVSLTSNPLTNILVALQIHNGANWITKEILQIQVGQKSVSIDTDIPIDNSILRITLLEGDFHNIEFMNVIARVENIF